MQMSTRREGDFTTNPSVVAQISKRQDVCLVSLKILQLTDFRLRKSSTRQHSLAICFAVLDLKAKFSFKIAAKGEGRKPDLNRQKFVAESELVLLSILYKLIIIIYISTGVQ